MARPLVHTAQPRAHREIGRDPTRTVTIRKNFSVDGRKRVRDVATAIRRGVGEDDVFRLQPRRPTVLQDARTELNRLRRRIEAAAKAEKWEEAGQIALEFVQHPGRFAFPEDTVKVDTFMEWLAEAQDARVLEVLRGPQREIVKRSEWSDVWIRRSYGRGVKSADAKLRRAGEEPMDDSLSRMFNRPIHADKLSILQSRTFTELSGMTEDMAKVTRRELAEGLAKGLNPRTMGRTLAGELEAIGRRRATLIARTEVIRAHAEATLNRFQEHGLDAVEGKAEFSTAGDDRVCPICQSLEGQKMSLEDARGVIPVHPSCRCTWLPLTQFSQNVLAGNEAFLERVRGAKARHFPDWYRRAA